MTAWAAIAGSATAWLLVLVLWTGLGYAAVLAWGRWGGRLPLPHPVERAVSVALGAPGAPRPRPAKEAAPPPPVAAAPAAMEAPEEVPAPPAEMEPAPAAPSGLVAADEQTDEPPEADLGEEVRSTGEGTHAPDAEPVAAQPSERTPRPARTLSRADALAELSGVLKIEYEAAAALLDHGLWGFENYEEWTRSMRGCTRPDDIPEAAWEAVTHRTWRDLEEEVEAYRVRHTALQGLEALWGVGPDEAAALYDAGYRDAAAIRKASTDAIAKIPGIGAAKAFQVRAAAHGLAPTP